MTVDFGTVRRPRLYDISLARFKERASAMYDTQTINFVIRALMVVVVLCIMGMILLSSVGRPIPTELSMLATTSIGLMGGVIINPHKEEPPKGQ